MPVQRTREGRERPWTRPRAPVRTRHGRSAAGRDRNDAAGSHRRPPRPAAEKPPIRRWEAPNTVPRRLSSAAAKPFTAGPNYCLRSHDSRLRLMRGRLSARPAVSMPRWPAHLLTSAVRRLCRRTFGCAARRSEWRARPACSALRSTGFGTATRSGVLADDGFVQRTCMSSSARDNLSPVKATLHPLPGSRQDCPVEQRRSDDGPGVAGGFPPSAS